MATNTPWGPAQQKVAYGRGINFYSTAGHGGYKVSTKLNASMPDHLRIPDGWYEEDCDWARVVAAFPDRFSVNVQDAAKKTLAKWAPDAYEQQYGEVLLPGQSYIKDAREFENTHAQDLVVVSAIGSGASYAPNVPKGMVGCIARIGAKRNGLDKANDRYFLVPENEYRQRSAHGFVIDVSKHQEIAEW
jgi:hypothetical protein